MLMTRLGLQGGSRFAVCLLAVGMAAGATQAQAPQGSQENSQGTISGTSRLVVLDVVVVDPTGKPVTNLDRSLFSITEDKVPQTIRNFDPPSGHVMPVSDDAVV